MPKGILILIGFILFMFIGLLLKDRLEKPIAQDLQGKEPAASAGTKSQYPEPGQQAELITIGPDMPEAESGFITQVPEDKELALELKRINNLIALDDKNANAFYNRGWLYGYKGETEKAIEDYTRAISIDRRYADAYYNRGLLYIRQGKYEQAVKDFTEVIKYRKKDADVYNNRGNAYTQMGKPEPALDDYNTALMIDPDDPDFYYNRGVVYRAMGKTKEARQDFQKAAEMGHKQARELFRRL